MQSQLLLEMVWSPNHGSSHWEDAIQTIKLGSHKSKLTRAEFEISVKEIASLQILRSYKANIHVHIELRMAFKECKCFTVSPCKSSLQCLLQNRCWIRCSTWRDLVTRTVDMDWTPVTSSQREIFACMLESIHQHMTKYSRSGRNKLLFTLTTEMEICGWKFVRGKHRCIPTRPPHDLATLCSFLHIH